MITPRTSREVRGILLSFNRIFRYKKLDYLTIAAYKYLHTRSGFIAHYNIRGFVDEYESRGGVYALAEDIMHNANNACCIGHFGPDEAPYYEQCAKLYGDILDLAKSYIPDLNPAF